MTYTPLPYTGSSPFPVLGGWGEGGYTPLPFQGYAGLFGQPPPRQPDPAALAAREGQLAPRDRSGFQGLEGFLPSTAGPDALLTIGSGGEGMGYGQLINLALAGLGGGLPGIVGSALLGNTVGRAGPLGSAAFSLATGAPVGLTAANTAANTVGDPGFWGTLFDGEPGTNWAALGDYFTGGLFDFQGQSADPGPRQFSYGSSGMDGQMYNDLASQSQSSMLHDYIRALQSGQVDGGVQSSTGLFTMDQREVMDNMLRFAGYDPTHMGPSDLYGGRRSDLIDVGGAGYHMGMDWGAGFNPWSAGGGANKRGGWGSDTGRPSGFFHF